MKTRLIALRMLARLQQLLVLALGASSAVWAAHFLIQGRPIWAAAGAGLIVFSYALVLAFEFACLWFASADAPTAPLPSSRQLLNAWRAEVLCVPRVFFWRQPFRSQTWPDHLPASGAGRRGVVFIHGFVCNRGIWSPWLDELHKQQVPFVAVNLEPIFGSIDAYPTLIDTAVRRIEACTGRPPVMVAHSMGGLAIRAWLRDFHADARVSRIITVGSPHLGTWLARFGFSRNAGHMRIGSVWLSRLASAEPAARYRLFTCFYGHCDNIVFPARNATLPGADNRHIAGTAHVQMAFEPAVVSEVWRLLDASTSAAPLAAGRPLGPIA